MHLQDSNLSLINCVIWNNFTAINSDINMWGSSSLSVTYSDIEEGWEGEGNIDQDPLFVGTGTHPYSLQSGSPCINSGIPDTTGMNLPEYDIIGNPRISGDYIDMGAYEWLFQSLSSPENVIIDVDPVSVLISWDAVSGATSYTVYSDADPYGSFTFDEWTGPNTSWNEPLTEEMKFYRVTASN